MYTMYVPAVYLSYFSSLWFFTIFVLCSLDAALTCSSDLNDILHTYTTGIITCDMDVIHSKKQPEKAIKSLFFNTYSMLIRILRNCFDSIKASALDAALMQQVDATEEEVNQAQDLNALFRCLNINRNWNELHFLDVAIISLPPEESVKREAALLVLGQYKSYLRAYQKATAIKEGKSEFGLLQRKRGREERWIVTEVTVDKDITDFTYADCLELWKLFLIKALKIPKDRIEFRLARAGNSTTLVFMITQTCAEGMKEKLSQPAAVWVMKELGILRVYVAGVVSVDLREVLPNVLIASIREGLKSGVDFVSLTKVCACMHACMWACLCVCVCVCVCVHRDIAVSYKYTYRYKLPKCMTMQALFSSIVLHTNVVLIHSHAL